MYHGPAIDHTIGSSCSASDLQQPRSPRPRRRRRVAAAPGVADDADNDDEHLYHEPAYVVLDVQSDENHGHGIACHAAPRPGRRRAGGNAIRILLLATAAAFLALAVSPVSGTTNEKEEETTTVSTVVITEESTKSRTGSDPDGSIDLLAALQLSTTTWHGVTRVPGLLKLKPAYYLQGDVREIRLDEASFERAVTLLRRAPEFTIAAVLRQEEANSGTIVAFSHGNNRYLELQSSGRRDELRLHYVSRRDGNVHVEAFPFRLADSAWHKVALSVSGSQIELLVDCHLLYRRLLRPGPPDTNFTLPQLQLWVGQRNARHFLFKGALQEVKLIAGPHGYLSQCPLFDSFCPTCGQFSILQNTVEQLMRNLNELTRRLAAVEGRISKVEECECQKPCRMNGTIHEDGATWEKDCQQCSCIQGEIECRKIPCAPVSCKNPVIPAGQCCPICLKQCLLYGVLYDHGERVSPKQCVRCDCFDGSFTCHRFDTAKTCPLLPCPPSEQISVAEECCKFCPGVDYCAKGHNCHGNASCLNLQTTYACHCDIGFQGDGHNCDDVDECQQQGGSEGHHCNANTKCVNTIGSYMCECLPGYHRVDKFNCAELDECTTNYHGCHEHATCVNTVGSYYCTCKEGYTGDGYTCKPICNQICQNGGECVAPGKCSCRLGYVGNGCEMDLDECASNLDNCHETSTCVNMPGWYYCRCKPGYRIGPHDSTQCIDIDECNDQTIERRHTCHPSATCINTEGGYTCSCPSHSFDNHTMEECRLSCWFENREVMNGMTVPQAGNPCRSCTCKDGVITCKDPVCDCSAPGSLTDKCCPQCDPAASCRHQDLYYLIFRSGERWIYQCQTCECLYGEIDCWQMECPPLTCLNPVTKEGDCCPRCEDDPCRRVLPANDTSLNEATKARPCSYSGIVYDSGSSWQDPHDKCTTCECKDGQLCCSYDYGCAGNLGSNGQQQRPPVVVPEPVLRALPGPAGSPMADGSPEAALSAVTTTAAAATATAAAAAAAATGGAIPVTSAYLLSASSSSSPVNSAATGGSIIRKGHWTLQNSLPSPSQQQRDGHRVRVQAQQQQQQQQQQAPPTTRYQLASRATTMSSSTLERVTLPSTSSTTTIKHEVKSQTSTARRQRAKMSNLSALRQRTNAFYTSTSSSSSSTSSSSSSSPSSSSSSSSSSSPLSSSPPLALLVPSGTSHNPQASDNASTSTTSTTTTTTTTTTSSESVVANDDYRKSVSTGGRHRRSDAGESVARDSGAT